MKIKIKKLSDQAIMPKRATEGSAAYDLYIPEDVLVEMGRQIIKLNFAIEVPEGYEAKIEPRSGYSSKGMEGLIRVFDENAPKEATRRFDCDVLVGKIDSDYRGEVGIIINNREDIPFSLGRGQRIAQMTIYKVEDAEFVETEELSDTERGDGGFGHTG